MCLRVLKESNKSRFDRYSRQKQCIDHIPYYLSALSLAHFSDNLSRNSCILIKTERPRTRTRQGLGLKYKTQWDLIEMYEAVEIIILAIVLLEFVLLEQSDYRQKRLIRLFEEMWYLGFLRTREKQHVQFFNITIAIGPFSNHFFLSTSREVANSKTTGHVKFNYFYQVRTALNLDLPSCTITQTISIAYS